MPDLWSTTQQQRQALAERWYGPQAQALPLTTGLWFGVRETPSSNERVISADTVIAAIYTMRLLAAIYTR